MQLDHAILALAHLAQQQQPVGIGQHLEQTTGFRHGALDCGSSTPWETAPV